MAGKQLVISYTADTQCIGKGNITHPEEKKKVGGLRNLACILNCCEVPHPPTINRHGPWIFMECDCLHVHIRGDQAFFPNSWGVARVVRYE